MKSTLPIILFASSLLLSFNNVVTVSDYLPDSYVKDGSVCYQKEIQQALDALPQSGGTVIFPAMVYKINEAGWTIKSNTTLTMYGAVFELPQDCKKDGAVFTGKDVTNVRFKGGEIIGHNEKWTAGVNIRGIYISGNSHNLHFNDLKIRNLSSNGIGIFGTADDYIRDIWISDVVVDNCCNYYGDYMSERPGPEADSEREDQGSIALYYCEDFHVSGSRFEKSRSDGTHFYKCRKGQFVNNKVYGAQMGGYFLEGCADVLAADNIIKNNGSRGTTIERGSKNCTLSDNIIARSGREGLWAPDCVGLIISGNIFEYNGRKPNGEKTNQKWNANITINEAYNPTHSPTADYLIVNNIFYTDENQHAVIYIDGDKPSDIVVKNNFLKGGNKKILIKGSNKDKIIIEDNF